MKVVREHEKWAEAEAARQREMAVLRHKRMRAGQAPTPMTTPVDHFQSDSRPPNWGPPPRRLSQYDLDMDARRRQFDYDLGQDLNDPGVDWGG
jgi:spore germination cell wall hydrolase CwlJ-like protein